FRRHDHMLSSFLSVVLRKNTQVLQNHRIQVIRINIRWQVRVSNATIDTFFTEARTLRSHVASITFLLLPSSKVCVCGTASILATTATTTIIPPFLATLPLSGLTPTRLQPLLA